MEFFRFTPSNVRLRLLAVCLASTVFIQSVPAQKQATRREHWVATWATSEPLGLVSTLPNGRGGALPVPAVAQPNAPPAVTVPAPPLGGRGRGPRIHIPPTLNDQTVRMIIHVGIGGRRIRIEFSNAMMATPVAIGAAHIAVRDQAAAIVPGTDRALTFNGKAGCTLGPGMLLFSDPVDLDVAPLSDLSVSLYLPKDTGPPTNHSLGMHTAYISQGDTTGQTAMPEPTSTGAYFWLSAVDVLAPVNAFAIVALGDSITDGQGTTVDANLNWTAMLNKRLAASKASAHISVLNQGVAGNQVLRTLSGVSALARFDRDVLSRQGVKWLIVFEGINDISLHGQTDSADPLTSDDMIAGYLQLIERAHAFGIRVVGATIGPQEGTRLGTPNADLIRNAINQWVRTGRAFDAVVDLDAAVRDPAHPGRLRAEFDSGDHIHINDLGNQAMAEAFNPVIFKIAK
ncbi:MAG: SGNH/GDSL hydrolase family protein [Terriglobia bacterium]